VIGIATVGLVIAWDTVVGVGRQTTAVAVTTEEMIAMMIFGVVAGKIATMTGVSVEEIAVLVGTAVGMMEDFTVVVVEAAPALAALDTAAGAAAPSPALGTTMTIVEGTTIVVAVRTVTEVAVDVVTRETTATVGVKGAMNVNTAEIVGTVQKEVMVDEWRSMSLVGNIF